MMDLEKPEYSREAKERKLRILIRIKQYSRFFIDNPSSLLVFVFGRFVVIRRICKGRRRYVPAACASRSALDIDCDRTLIELQHAGISQGVYLRQEVLRGIQNFANNNLCFGNADVKYPFFVSEKESIEQKFGQRFIIGEYRDTINSCPEINILQNDIKLRYIARNYLNSEPILVRSRLWWSFKSSDLPDSALAPYAQESFHFDLDDWICLKFFFYITDVGLGNGPHKYVAGSHKRRSLRDQFNPYKARTLEQIIKYYGAETVQTICGAAGFGFAQDPYGYHTGSRVQESSPRLIFEIQYGLKSRPLMFPYYSGHIPQKK